MSSEARRTVVEVTEQVKEQSPVGQAGQVPEQSPRRGLKLRVLRQGGANDRSGGGVSYRSNHLYLVGTVVYEQQEPVELDQYDPENYIAPKPVIEPLADTYQLTEVDESADLGVWLVVNRHGYGERYFVPEDPDTGQPMLSVMAWGGNYADGLDVEFRHLVGMHNYAFPVHDKRVRRERPNEDDE